MLVSVSNTLALVAAVLPCALAASGPPAPSQDPFYQPPAGYQAASLGTILKNRAVNTSFLNSFSNVQAYQLLYRTRAVNGSAIAGVTTVFKPANAALDRFVSFQTAYDSSATICNPSYVYQKDANQTNPIVSFEEMFIQDFLDKGYIVSASDYEGPDAAFSAGRLAGYGVLDSMRAVTKFKTLGFNTSTPGVVGYGYSGGAIATGWAAGLQPNYANELKIKGWALGGTPANLTGTLVFLDDSLFSGFVPDAVAGLLKPSAYLAQLKPLVDSIATAKGLAYLDYTNSHCAVDDVTNFPGQSILSTEFQTLGPALLQNSKVKAVLLENLMGNVKKETPTAPVYMYHAQGDEIIPYANATALAATWCNYGASVQFKTILTGGHATGETNGFSGALSFVQSAFAGTVAKGCSKSVSIFATKLQQAAAFHGVSAPVAKSMSKALEIVGEDDKNVKADPKTLEKLGDI